MADWFKDNAPKEDWFSSNAPKSGIPGMEKLGKLPSISTVPQSGKQSRIAQYLGAAPEGHTQETGLTGAYVNPKLHGITSALEGVAALSGSTDPITGKTPTMDERIGAASKVFRGVGQTAAPTVLPIAAITNPVATAAALGGGAVGAGAGSIAANMLDAGSGVKSAMEDVGGTLLGGAVGSKIAGRSKVSSSETPGNAMVPGNKMPMVPELAEWLPGVGKLAKLYNKGAKMVNSGSEARVEQVPGRPAPVPYDHPLARASAPPVVPAVEQVPGKAAPIPAGHPLSKAVDLAPYAVEPHTEPAYPTIWGGPPKPGPLETPPGGTWGRGYRATKAPGPGPIVEPQGGWPDVQYQGPRQPGPIEQPQGGWPEVKHVQAPQAPPVSNKVAPVVKPYEHTFSGTPASEGAGTGTGTGTGVGRVYDWYTQGHGGHQQNIDINVNKILKNVPPEQITPERYNAARVSLGKSPVRPAELPQRLEMFRKTAAQERASKGRK